MSFANHFRVRIVIDEELNIHKNKQIMFNQKPQDFNYQNYPFFNKVVGKEKPITIQPVFYVHEQGIILKNLKRNKN